MRPKTNCKPVEEKKTRQTKSANLNDSRGDLCFYGWLLHVMGFIFATLETEGNWSRNASRECFRDRYRERASLPRRRSYGFVTRSCPTLRVTNPSERLRGRLGTCRSASVSYWPVF